MKRIMVIAGTKDAREMITELLKTGVEVLATVTTGFGRQLLETCPAIRIHEGRLDAEGMKSLILDADICCVLDASHPFAREASLNAMRACGETGTEYLRLERRGAAADGDGVTRVKSFEEAAAAAGRMEGNILLTVGSNSIEVFTRLIPDFGKRLFARVLPDSGVIAKCERAGLSAANILALKGPFSEEMNMEMIKYCNAAVLVTKESGEAGGTAEKLKAASRLGISVILVERPEMDYGRKAGTVEEAVEFVKKGILKEGEGEK